MKHEHKTKTRCDANLTQLIPSNASGGVTRGPANPKL